MSFLRKLLIGVMIGYVIFGEPSRIFRDVTFALMGFELAWSYAKAEYEAKMKALSLAIADQLKEALGINVDVVLMEVDAPEETEEA